MGSNEEYLDNLLKSMSDDNDKEDSFMSSEEIEAMFAEAERVANGSLEDELEEMDDEMMYEPLAESAAGNNGSESITEESHAEESIAEESPVEKSPAAEASVTEGVEEPVQVSSDLSAEAPADENDESFGMAPEDENEDLLSLLGSLDGDEELNEISELLQKSDNNVPVDENMFAASDDGESAETETAVQEVMEETEGTEGKKQKKKKEKPRKIKKEKREEKQGEEESQEEKESGKKGFFSRLMTILTEEEEAESDENQAILQQLDEEDKQAANKKKKMKKGKLPGGGKEEAEADEEGKSSKGGKAGKKDKKPKKEKKPKKVKEPKEKPAAIEEKPSRKISKKSIVVVVLFAATVFAVVFFASTFLSGELQRQSAKDAYDKLDYAAFYENMYGMKLSEEEQNMFEHAQIVLKMQRRLSVYEKYVAEDMELEALDSLMRVIEGYDDIYAQAQTYGAAAEVAAIYDRILQILESTYGLTEAEARAIAFCDSNVEYTRYLTALTNGETLSVEGSANEALLPQEENEDILPAEEELIPPEFAD